MICYMDKKYFQLNIYLLLSQINTDFVDLNYDPLHILICEQIICESKGTVELLGYIISVDLHSSGGFCTLVFQIGILHATQ